MTPAVRISLGLVALTVSILLAADTFFKIFPDRIDPLLEARKNFCESLAAQYSTLIESGDVAGMQKTMASVVERTPEVLSIGLRSAEHGLLTATAGHLQLWVGAKTNSSTPTHAQVPIFDGSERWGTVEVRFKAIDDPSLLSFLKDPLYRLALIMAGAGFAVYLLFMRRTLRYLDPSSVVPGRVRAALDQLVEGAVLLDEQLRLVLTNASFAEKVGRSPESLMGTSLSELSWHNVEGELPWERVRRDGNRCTEVRLELETPSLGLRTLSTNVSPIVDGTGKQRGVLATFDDISELEQTNRELEQTIESLQTAQAEIKRQNEELNRLATEDSLTGALNRRAFFAKLESEFDIARKEGLALSCIMADIDHFKGVNDNYGHAVGDVLIKEMSDVLSSTLRQNDAVGRYGGEEFCVVLVGSDAEGAEAVAERARQAFRQVTDCADGPTSGKVITASFGVSAIDFGADDAAAMVDQADQALYSSKTSGRNRVTSWATLETAQAKAS